MSIYIALGANLSNPAQTFRRAMAELEGRGVKVLSLSGLWQSPAWPAGSGQPDYINACARIKTRLSARGLLAILHDVEAQFGRARGALNAARTLDLDLLDYNGENIDAADITIPHPRMLDRAFVLFPLQEIAPQWRDPIESRSIEDWLARLPLRDVAPLTKL
ncbi:MAG: 2-amino-4-hydroxy-6-hydroxymethyldihydropteridine diphosphokinase [Robiginitomaculum sp.]